MKVLLLLALVIGTQAFAEESPKINAGLWNIQMLVVGPDGKEHNPAESIKAALKELPPEQQKEILAKLGGAALEDKDLQVCLTEQMVKDPDTFLAHDKGNCESKTVTKTATVIKNVFSCKDGNKGDATWTIKNPNEYEGKINSKTKDGKTSMSYKGKFVKADCGSVKPAL